MRGKNIVQKCTEQVSWLSSQVASALCIFDFYIVDISIF